MEFIKLVMAIGCGYVVGQLMLEILGMMLDWAGKATVKLFYAAVQLVTEQRKQVAIAAAKAQAEESAKIVRE